MYFKQFFTGIKNNSLSSAIKNFAKNKKTIAMQQVHGNKINNIDLLDLNSDKKIIQVDNVDACFTTKKNILLSVKSADCLPILISGYGNKTSKSKKIQPFIAAAHAGRKGTELKIIYELLKKLDIELNITNTLKQNLEDKENSSSNLEKNKLNIWFGPAICVDCYQINRKTNAHYNLIQENKKQILKFFEKYKLDLKKNLNLEIENNCTLHEPEKYYSYRKTGPGVKMNYSFIEISSL